jgi:hypothetical protein
MRDESSNFEARFCQEYILDLNGAAAYERAGGKTTSPASSAAAASRLLKKPRVISKIRDLLGAAAKDSQIEFQRILQELSTLAYSDITKFLERDVETGGWMVKDLEELPSSLTPAIKKLTCTYSHDGRKETIELHDKSKALSILSDYAGLRLDLNKAINTMAKYGIVTPINGGYKFILSPGTTEDIDDD